MANIACNTRKEITPILLSYITEKFDTTSQSTKVYSHRLETPFANKIRFLIRYVLKKTWKKISYYFFKQFLRNTFCFQGSLRRSLRCFWGTLVSWKTNSLSQLGRQSVCCFWMKIVQVNNSEIVVNFFHISHTLTWYCP